MRGMAMLAAALMLTGCAAPRIGTVADVKSSPPLHQASVPGSYSQLARCVVGKMQNDERWSINLMQYNVQIYPDNETAEIQASVPSMGAVIYAVIIHMTQTKGMVDVKIQGGVHEGEAAVESLQSCARPA